MRCGSCSRGALIDTSSIVYTNSLFILLSILPLPMRIWGGGRYQSAMFLVYVMFNGAFIIAANMADAVYFHYALKRCTSDEIFFAENGNTFSLVLKFAVENWYMVLLSLAMIAALAWGYRRRRESIDLTRGVVRYTLLTVVMLLAAWLSIGGMRGGMNGMTRPITLSNAMLYTSSSAKAYLIMSNPFCVIRSVDAHLEYCRYFDDDERAEALFSPSHYPEDYTSEMFGRYEGYNVVLFILESFSAEHSKYLSPDLYPGDEAGHTPFLDELMQRSLTFTRCYANGGVGGRTIVDMVLDTLLRQTFHPHALCARRVSSHAAPFGRQGLRYGILLRIGARLYGLRRLCPSVGHRPPVQHGGFRSRTR